MSKTKTAVVCFANSTGRYLQGQERLRQTVMGYSSNIVDWLAYNNEAAIGSPSHKENPYAFKLYAIMKAREAGYDKILYLDASVYAIRPIDPVIAEIENNGYIMQEAGCLVGVWANDRCLEYFNLDRDEAMGMMMYGNAGFLGLNFEHKTAQQFFESWLQSCKDGIFKGGWRNDNNQESQDPRCNGHRHDMVCGSIIANQLDMKYVSGNEWLQYAPPHTPPKNEKIYFKAQGL